MKLYIGNKNYSTWSLRAWILMAKSGISFEEIKLPLDTPRFYDALQSVTPAQKVPCLTDGEITVWDSLAICEYINDIYLSGNAWPTHKAAKAKARALAAEMHSGFVALRSEMPMNIRASRQIDLSESGQKDLQRIDQIFSEQMDEYAERGGWLFGEFSIADAMYIPVVLRLITYQIPVSAGAQKYVDHVMTCETLQTWMDEGRKETDIVEKDEAGVPV